MLSALISIFHLPIRYCSLELPKNIFQCSHENVGMHSVFKDYRSIVNIVNSLNNAKRIDFYLLFIYSLVFFILILFDLAMEM